MVSEIVASPVHIGPAAGQAQVTASRVTAGGGYPGRHPTTRRVRAQADGTRTAQADGARLGQADGAGLAQADGARLGQADGAGLAQADGAGLAQALAAERHVTLELQRAILPLHTEPFDLPGLRAAVRYLPASRDSRVGGDWYITAEMPGGHVLLAIGDVGGHGLAAAAGMARLRGALAGLAITGSPPERLLGWLNDLVHHVDPEHTASVMAGYYDPFTRILTWAQAGHPPPVLVRAEQARALEPPPGILLGAGRLGYQAASTTLEPADLLLLYSDGLIERRDRSLEDGLAILIRAAAGIRDPDEVITAVLGALGSTDPEDDTCLVALQVR